MDHTVDTTVLVLSDLHDGNKKAIRKKPANNEQKVLLHNLKQIIRHIAPIQVCILLGDMVDGYNEKAHGLGTWTTDVAEQVDDVYDVVKMTGARKYYGVTGSPYHTQQNLNADSVLYESLDAEYGTDMALDIDGVKFYCCHKIGTSASIYQQSAMSVQLTKASIWKDKLGDFDVQLRGHTHYFCYQGSGNHLGVICPCSSGTPTHTTT